MSEDEDRPGHHTDASGGGSPSLVVIIQICLVAAALILSGLALYNTYHTGISTTEFKSLKEQVGQMSATLDSLKVVPSRPVTPKDTVSTKVLIEEVAALRAMLEQRAADNDLLRQDVNRLQINSK